MTFEDLGLAPNVFRAVEALGYKTPTPIQKRAIPPSLHGHDVLGSAQTGTGKTAAFALPVLNRLCTQPSPGRRRPIRALVLAPTRELANQISDCFRQYGQFTDLRHAVIYGGVSQVPQTRALHRGADILIATPGRLLDLMGQGYVNLDSVQTVVLDEADRMLDMGFLPDIRRVLEEIPEERQTLMYSATMPPAIRRLADSVLTDPVQIQIEPTKALAPKIDQWVYFIPQRLKIKMLDGLLSHQPGSRTVVFTRTKHGADSVVEDLRKAGFRADAIHGNKSQSKRQLALNNFKRNHTQVLVATDVAARGIDVDDISHVVNYDLPHEPETYIHRIGRTGRAGAAGIAISFCDHFERKHLRAIEREIGRQLPIGDSILDLGTTVPPARDAAPAPRPRQDAEQKPKQFRKPNTGSRRNAPASEYSRKKKRRRQFSKPA